MTAADRFRAAVESMDHAAAVATLAEDVIFHSPVTFRAFEGRDATAFVLVQDFIGVPTIDLTIHFRARTEGLTGPALAIFRSRASAEGFFEEDGELWSQDGTLLAQSRQLGPVLG